jgi:hypothetical protein
MSYLWLLATQYLWGISLGALLILLTLSHRSVPEGEEYLVERFGKHVRTLKSGLNFIIPFFESTRRVDVKERTIERLLERVMTKDHIQIDLPIWMTVRVIDSNKATNVTSLDFNLIGLVGDSIRNALAGLNQDEIHTKWDELKTQISTKLKPSCERWGVEIFELFTNNPAFEQRGLNSLIVASARKRSTAAAADEVGMLDEAAKKNLLGAEMYMKLEVTHQLADFVKSGVGNDLNLSALTTLGGKRSRTETDGKISHGDEGKSPVLAAEAIVDAEAVIVPAEEDKS